VDELIEAVQDLIDVWIIYPASPPLSKGRMMTTGSPEHCRIKQGIDVGDRIRRAQAAINRLKAYKERQTQ